MATMVPIVPGMRRKRDDDNDTINSESDSMRPVAPETRRNKRRRTILDAFNSMSFQKNKVDHEFDDADSSQAVAEEYYYTDSSSLEDEEDIDDDNDNDEAKQLLSDQDAAKKKAERKVMLELVFGPDTSDPAERKLNEIMRNTMQRGTSTGSQDDMSLDTSYNSGSSTLSTARDFNSPVPLQRSNSFPETRMETVNEGDVDMDY